MISTHVLDTMRGEPAVGVPVVLDSLDVAGGSSSREIARAVTDADGRVRELWPAGTELLAGCYRLTFDTGAYAESLGVESFYPEVAIVFEIRDSKQRHYHVPLLLSPYGYTTYRGS